MRRIPKISIWYLVFLAIIGVAAAALAKGADPAFADFPTRYARYALSSQQDARFVVFGASYTALLPFESPFQNLGVGGSRPKEHVEILKRIRKSSTPVYMFSRRDINFSNWPMRPPMCNPYLHAAMAARRALRGRQAPWVRETASIDDFPKGTLDGSGIEHFRTIRAMRPDTIFVFTPAKIMQPPVETLRDNLAKKLSAESFRVIDLSHMVPQEDFEEPYHVKPHLRKQVASAIETAVSEFSR